MRTLTCKNCKDKVYLNRDWTIDRDIGTCGTCGMEFNENPVCDLDIIENPNPRWEKINGATTAVLELMDGNIIKWVSPSGQEDIYNNHVSAAFTPFQIITGTWYVKIL